VARRADGSVVAWGRNVYGECVIPAPTTNFVSMAVGEYHTVGLRSDGTVHAWGAGLMYNPNTFPPSDHHGQSLPPSPNGGFFAIDAGGGRSFAIRPDTPSCPQADINCDGLVNVNDLLAVINAWGNCPPPPASCPADIAPPGGDGVVNVNDLLMVINNWG
jgi:alpha-tubulin suppressor-like RCC1 family protein